MGSHFSKLRKSRSYSVNDISSPGKNAPKLPETKPNKNNKVAEKVRMFEKLIAASKSESDLSRLSDRQDGRVMIKKSLISSPVCLVADPEYGDFIETFLNGKFVLTLENQAKLPLYLCDKCADKIPEMIDIPSEEEQPNIANCPICSNKFTGRNVRINQSAYQNRCILCFGAHKALATVLFEPCMHLNTCQGCSLSRNSCTICKFPVAVRVVLEEAPNLDFDY